LLLTELLNAVEGVERSLQAMQTAAVAAQAKADDYTAQFSPRDPEPVHGSHLSDPVVADVWDKFINMIVWARAVEGRVQRRGEGGDPGRGLLPALARGPLRDQIGRALGHLRLGHLPNVGLLANHSVHGGTRASVTPRSGLDASGEHGGSGLVRRLPTGEPSQYRLVTPRRPERRSRFGDTAGGTSVSTRRRLLS
jgi:hypothetical protein